MCIVEEEICVCIGGKGAHVGRWMLVCVCVHTRACACVRVHWWKGDVDLEFEYLPHTDESSSCSG